MFYLLKGEDRVDVFGSWEFWTLGMQNFRGSGVQGLRAFEVWRLWGSKVWALGFRGSAASEHSKL